MGDLAHEFAFSPSRARGFEDCLRKHYWSYYGAWRGWEDLAPPERRKAYFLKGMSAGILYCGTAVHEAIAEWFRARKRGEGRTKKMVRDDAVGRFKKAYEQSKSRRAMKVGTKKAVLFEEHYYGDERIDTPAHLKKLVEERIEAAVEDFFTLAELAEVTGSDPSTWLYVDDDSIDSFELGGHKVYATPDFVMRRDDGTVLLVDWKTGRPKDADEYQISFYTFWAMAKGYVPKTEPQRAKLMLAYLGNSVVKELGYGVRGLRAIWDSTMATIAQMQELHFDAGESAGDVEQFPMTDDTSRCRWCPFRELCER